jgi:hypothetical protein
MHALTAMPTLSSAMAFADAADRHCRRSMRARFSASISSRIDASMASASSLRKIWRSHSPVSHGYLDLIARQASRFISWVGSQS